MLAVAPAMEVGYVFSGGSAVGSVSSSTIRRVPLCTPGVSILLHRSMTRADSS